jgi:hypothetical protein
MKPQVITLFPYANYGAALQAFALQRAVCGELVRIFAPASSFVSPQKRQQDPILACLLAFFRKARVRFKIYQFFSKGFPEIEKNAVSQKQLLFPSKVYIVGSDQVWNSKILDMKNIYFLIFASPLSRRISYAASLGAPKWPKDFEQKVLPELHKFHAISVREESSAEYPRSLGLNVVSVCDPTILYAADFYRKEFYKPNMKQQLNGPFNFIYRMREEFSGELIQKLKNKKLVWQDMRKRKRIPVAEWLWNIDHADLVITDSFHAVVFCLLFHTPFEVILNQGAGKGMNERFSTLLGKAGLPLAPNPTEIDWESVDAKLAEWREYSRNWLMTALREQEKQTCP